PKNLPPAFNYLLIEGAGRRAILRAARALFFKRSERRGVSRRMKLRQLREDIEKGVASLNSGKGKLLHIEAIKAEGRRRRKAAKKARK
ncbi:MAG: hypothetical protein J2P52_01630, partial [Blastocatellia bacterium]|nr:hypothetical protein [Blastocatellia bacterium]